MTSCDVCLYEPDDLNSEFYSESIVKARKQHRCVECRYPIESGMRYQRESGKCDGEVFSTTTCLLCAEIRRVFHCGGGYQLGTLWEDMQEEAFPRLTTASECFRELSPGAKACVMEKWIVWKGLTPAKEKQP